MNPSELYSPNQEASDKISVSTTQEKNGDHSDSGSLSLSLSAKFGGGSLQRIQPTLQAPSQRLRPNLVQVCSQQI
jgi:hypothetical protein